MVRDASKSLIRAVERRHIVLVGLMGSGKTTVGRALADGLGRRFVYSDQELARRTGRTARAIADADGLEALHRQEAAALLGALEAQEPSVLAAASSTIEHAACRRALATDELRVVYLRADPTVLAERVGAQPHRPRQLTSEQMLAEQAVTRGPLFERVADLVVDVGRRTPEEVLAAIRAGVGIGPD
jgi:shikimate kinase